MPKPAQGPTTTAECQEEADKLRAYCESKFPLGPSANSRYSVTGETFTELCIPWSDGLASAADARIAAQDHFDRHASGKAGTLYWRIVPEIARDKSGYRFAYYLRLLISSKPHARAL